MVLLLQMLVGLQLGLLLRGSKGKVRLQLTQLLDLLIWLLEFIQ